LLDTKAQSRGKLTARQSSSDAVASATDNHPKNCLRTCDLCSERLKVLTRGGYVFLPLN
jgi:hypothetical protein